MSGSSPARGIAQLMLWILLIGSGIALSVSVSGNRDLAMQICMGAVGLNVLILILGAFIVAANRPRG
jgi:hypothetical protein